MHVQGVREVRDGHDWVGATDLPHLSPEACSPVFGLPADDPTASPVAPRRGIPDERSDLLTKRYFKDASSVYGDTGP